MNTLKRLLSEELLWNEIKKTKEQLNINHEKLINTSIYLFGSIVVTQI